MNMGSRDAISALGKPFDPVTMAAPANADTVVYDSATGKWKAQAPTGGVTSITGTAGQVTASAATGAVTLSIPNPLRVATIQAPAATALALGAAGATHMTIATTGHVKVGADDNAFFSVTALAGQGQGSCVLSADANQVTGQYAGYPYVAADARGTLLLYDYTNMAAGVGPGLLFGAKQNGAGNGYNAACVKSYKENATDGNTQTSVVVATNGGASVTDALALRSSGDACVKSGCLVGWTASTTDPKAAAVGGSTGGQKAVPDATLTTFCKVSVPVGTAVGGRVDYTAFIDVSALMHARAGSFTFIATNEAGVVNVVVSADTGTDCATGYASVTPAATTGTNEINLQVTATCGAGGGPGPSTFIYTVALNGTATVTPQ